MLVYDEKVSRHFWRIAIATGILPSRDSEIRRAIMRITKTKTILKTRKLFTIYGALHPKSIVDRLYISIEDCVELAIRGLEVHVHGSDERLTQAARENKIDGLVTAIVLKRSKKDKRLDDWEEKVLHGQYLRQTKEVRSDQCWAWPQNGDLKRETESLIVAAQNQSIFFNPIAIFS